MTKQEKENWKKRQSAEDAGFDPKPWEGCAVHSQNTAKHEFVKWCLTWILDDMDRAWDTETQCESGRVDVFDFGSTDGEPLVYEVETGVTDRRKREKVNQYKRGPVRDVIVIDPADVPDNFEAAIEYLRTYEVI